MGFVNTTVGKRNGAQARRGVRGPPGPTIIFIKEIIRFNNNNNNNNANNNNIGRFRVITLRTISKQL